MAGLRIQPEIQRVSAATPRFAGSSNRGEPQLARRRRSTPEMALDLSEPQSGRSSGVNGMAYTGVSDSTPCARGTVVRPAPLAPHTCDRRQGGRCRRVRPHLDRAAQPQTPHQIRRPRPIAATHRPDARQGAAEEPDPRDGARLGIRCWAPITHGVTVTPTVCFMPSVPRPSATA